VPTGRSTSLSPMVASRTSSSTVFLDRFQTGMPLHERVETTGGLPLTLSFSDRGSRGIKLPRQQCPGNGSRSSWREVRARSSASLGASVGTPRRDAVPGQHRPRGTVRAASEAVAAGQRDDRDRHRARHRVVRLDSRRCGAILRICRWACVGVVGRVPTPPHECRERAARRLRRALANYFVFEFLALFAPEAPLPGRVRRYQARFHGPFQVREER